MSKKITVALITYCLYPKPLDPLPLPIAWGQHHESTAIQKYIACKKKVTVENVVSLSIQNMVGLVHHLMDV